MMGSVLFGLTELGASSLENGHEKQIAAVTQKYYTIQKIGIPDKKIPLDAVAHDGRAIKSIDREVQLAAVKQKYHAIYLKNAPGF